MKKKIITPIFASALLLSNGIMAFAAPEVINVGGTNTVFDAEYYASANPDVAAALGTGRDALVQHYTSYGKAENRPAYAPGTDVDTLLAAADVQEKKVKSESKFYQGELTMYYEYDEQGNISFYNNINDGNVLSYTYTYDEQGNVLSMVRSDGSTYTYDGRGNVLSRTFSDGYTDTYTYTYDEQGNVLSQTDFYGTITYTYDNMGNVLSDTDRNGNTTTYTYDSRGNVLLQSDSRGYNTTYTYDSRGNVLSTTSDFYGRFPGTITYTYTYDEQGNVLSQTDSNGYTTTYTYF